MTHPVALNCLGQNNCGLTFALDGRVKSRIHLVRIVAPSIETPNVFVTHSAHHLKEFGMLAKEMLAHISAIICFIGLILTVKGLFHHLTQEDRKSTRLHSSN